VDAAVTPRLILTRQPQHQRPDCGGSAVVRCGRTSVAHALGEKYVEELDI
jgi:hypothetical protein